MAISYQKLIALNPTVYDTLVNSIGQTIVFVEHPTQGDETQVICGIIKKARKINLASNVKTIKDALILLRKKFVPIIPQHPELRHLSIRDLATYINDPFFDSLKLDYQEFNSWFQKCLQENRYSYSLFIENKLSALLIYKVEAVEEHQIEKIFHKALKISTFKVGENAVRHKIGELFLRKMFEYCINQNIQTLYLTVFPKHQILISLLETYGFTKYSKNKRGEFVMVKDMMKPSLIFAMNNSNVKTYPFYTDVNVNKFIVPISHRFYNRLFKDGKLRVPNLFDESLNSFAAYSGFYETDDMMADHKEYEPSFKDGKLHIGGFTD